MTSTDGAVPKVFLMALTPEEKTTQSLEFWDYYLNDSAEEREKRKGDKAEDKAGLKELMDKIDNDPKFREKFLGANDTPETHIGPRGGMYTKSITKEGRPYRRYY